MLGLVLLAGCGRIAFDPVGDARSRDALPDAACISFGPWNPPEPIVELTNGAPEYDPTQRSDRLQFWSVVPADGAIYTARRASTSDAYGPLVREPFNGMVGNDQDPAPTGDGLSILWSSNRTSLYLIYEARRATAADEFGLPALALGLESFESNSMDITVDGLTLYFTPGGVLYRARRPSLGAAFDTPTSLGLTVQFPAISADELELYYSNGLDIVVRTRASVADAFGPETVVPGTSGFGDPDLSADGSELLINSGTDTTYRLTRSCQ
jgi:hypothetical protein